MARAGSNTIELLRALAVLAEPPSNETARLAELLELGAPPTASDFTELFVLHLYPYASVYLGPEGMIGGEARDRIAGFWRAIGETPPPEPDHLAVMLAQYATLVDAEHSERDPVRQRAIGHARVTFLDEHLLSWLPVYLDAVSRQGSATYRAWAVLVRGVLAAHAQDVERSGVLPLHLREAPPLPDPATVDRNEFLGCVLAPIRSGMILTRHDLARLADATGLALRAGERRYALGAFLDQNGPATWNWLASEATAWASRHAEATVGVPQVREFWSVRAATAARQFAEFASHKVDASPRASQ